MPAPRDSKDRQEMIYIPPFARPRLRVRSHPVMRAFSLLRSLQQAGWLLAMCVALGGPWATLQSVAWTSMLLRYTQTAPTLAAAFAETFNGEHPCDLCRTIQKEKGAEKNRLPQGTIDSAKELVLFHQRVPLTLRAPVWANAPRHFMHAIALAGIAKAPPLLPPPRFGL